MTTLTMELKLSTADLMAPHSCSMNATTFNEAFSTEHAAQNQNFETIQPRGHTLKNTHSIEKVPPLYPNLGPDFASLAYHHENLIPGPPDESLIYSSVCAKSPGGLADGKASNSSQSEDIAVLREVLSSPESLQSWNGSDIQTSNCLPDNWCQIMKPLTQQIPTRSILESADIQDSEDFLDAYIAGLT